MDLEPAWNNSTEYSAIESPEFYADYESAKKIISEIELLSTGLTLDSGKSAIPILWQISKYADEAFILATNIGTFVNCESSLDATNTLAERWHELIQKLLAELNVALVAKKNFLKLCSPELLQEFLSNPKVSAESFSISQDRALAHFSLSESIEKTIATLSQPGLHAWGNLYSQTAGKLKVDLRTGKVGIAQANGMLRSGNESERKEAWHAIQNAWKTVEDPMAAVLNNLASFRLEICKMRSHQQPMHFLTTPLHVSTISEETLNAMLSAIERRLPALHKIYQFGAKILQKPKMDPWDLSAPHPHGKDTKQIPFSEGLEMVRASFASISKEMGDFVTMMHKNGWIEARVLPNKRPGGFCTKFPKSRTPRIYQTYTGTKSDVGTLAHELGHAYHNWVIRDLSLHERKYPMTLAETASLFSESVMNEALLEKCSPDEKEAQLWNELNHAATLLVNISARFEFEKNFYEARKNGPLTAKDLSELTDAAWKKWYGDTLSQYESQFWMTKMHFSISTLSFYNFPYSFGYLFALGIYAQKTKLGNDFVPFYHAVLLDTGRMTAEDLIRKHLSIDIRKSEFWEQSLDVVESKINSLFFRSNEDQ